ncbi:MAG: glycosyltransferase family 2 protein [Vicinamibacterales bacterium]|nr:glycosyltransferase family 2 protein [Vicinamibacterales bacterium]
MLRSLIPSVTLFLPVLNEIDGLRAMLPDLCSKGFDQILLVDGGSRDGSVEFARTQGVETYVQHRKGIRHAYIEAWPKIRGEFVVTFSPDGNCPAEALHDLVGAVASGRDMVIASRYLPPARSEDDDLLTGFGNWMFTTLINLCHGGRYTDAMGIYRAYRTSLFGQLDLDKESSYAPETICGTVIGIEPLLSIRCAKKRLNVSEIPVSEPARMGGTRKLQMFRWGAAYLLQVFREMYYWR